MKYLFEDDRTDLQDTLLWQKIFGGIHLFETEKAYFLQKRLWTLRSMGMMIKPSRHGLRFDRAADSAWETDGEFESMKREVLLPYADEIKLIFKELEADNHGVNRPVLSKKAPP